MLLLINQAYQDLLSCVQLTGGLYTKFHKLIRLIHWSENSEDQYLIINSNMFSTYLAMHVLSFAPSLAE